MEKKVLIDIPSYEDLKKYNISELKALSYTIRRKIIDLSKSKSIHLSSNLGIVELSIALLYVFNSPNDQIVYDTGHQSYVHKILTNRSHVFESIRDENGLSGFQEPNESIHDFVSGGHTSTALSICEGANETELNIKKNYIPVVGDGALSSGLSFEALNNIAFNKTRMLIVINDNDMSISENVGALYTVLNDMKNSCFALKSDYLKNKMKNKNIFQKIDILFKSINKKIKFDLNRNNFFEMFGFKYIGVIDGNDIKKTINALKKAQYFSKFGPTILHVKTKKGYGLKEAEADKDGFYHSIKLYSPYSSKLYYGEVAANFISKLVEYDKNIIVYNPAMTYSSGFKKFAKKYPNNFEDVGIAEEHLVTKASGASLVNRKVFVNVYSTFLQRAYDNILHDVYRLKLPIVFLIDRADISYQDGDSHHGIYDVSFLKTMQNNIITSPSNKFELEKLIKIAYLNNENPFFIRYPKEFCPEYSPNKDFEFGDWIWIIKKLGSKKCIISYGNIINEFITKTTDKMDFDLINAIFITSYKKDQVIKILKKYRTIFVAEKVIDNNCLANDLIQIAYENKIEIKIVKFNVKISEVGFGNKKSIDKKLNLDVDTIIKKVISTN